MVLAVVAMLGICKRGTLVVETGGYNWAHSRRNWNVHPNLCSGHKTGMTDCWTEGVVTVFTLLTAGAGSTVFTGVSQ